MGLTPCEDRGAPPLSAGRDMGARHLIGALQERVKYLEARLDSLAERLVYIEEGWHDRKEGRRGEAEVEPSAIGGTD